MTPPRSSRCARSSGIAPAAFLAALPLVALVLALTARPAVAQATIAGTWFTEDSSSKVTITNTGGAYTGKVTWLKNPAAVDAKSEA